MFAGGSSPAFFGNNRNLSALKLTTTLCFTLFLAGTLVFTVIPLTRHLLSPIPTTKIPAVSSPLELIPNPTAGSGVCLADDPIDCHDPDVFHLLMTAAFERFKDVHFLQFGKPAMGDSINSCHVAWKFKPKKEGDNNTSPSYKDYRSFSLEKSKNCTVIVKKIGEFHSGSNAIGKIAERKVKNGPIFLPNIDEDDSSTSGGKYLFYSGGGDKCKSMNQYVWSFICMLGEARYLNRTPVIDTSVCLSKIHTNSGKDEEGRDFRSYIDFEHLRDSWPVIERARFFSGWNDPRKKNVSTRFIAEGSARVSSRSLLGLNHTLVVRKFGAENYWYEVCEGGNNVVDRPWKFIWKSRPLMDIALAISARMGWDFDAIRVVRGEKAKDKKIWPNLDRDTSPGKIMGALVGFKVKEGRNLYISTDEKNSSFFDPLREKYSVRFLGENADLWGSESDWEMETRKLNDGNKVEFDAFMRESVDEEVFARAKRRFETFNDLTRDCKDGINTCDN